MKNFLFFIFLLCVTTQFGEGIRIKIGAIFFEDEEDLANAFTTAVYTSNKRLIDIELVSIIRYAPADDSMVLQKFACDLIANGSMAIFGPSSKASSDIVASVCHYIGIPHIRFDTTHDETVSEKLQHSKTINVFPSILGLSKAYADVVSNYEWKSFTIIYDEDQSLLKLQDVLQLYPAHKSGIILRKINKDEPYGVIWKSTRYNSERRIILDCSADIVLDVLKSAKEFNMTGQLISILLTNLDMHSVDFTELVKITANLTAIKIDINNANSILPTTTLITAIIFDAVQLLTGALVSLRNEKVPLYEHNLRCDLDRQRQWFVGDKIYEKMKMVNTENNKEDEEMFITKRMQFDDYGERITFTLDIYYPMSSTQVAIWGPQGQFADKNKTTASAQPDVNEQPESDTKMHLIVATRLGEPYLKEKVTKDGEILQGNARYEGYSLDLIHKLSETANFDYTIQIVSDNKYGAIDPATKEWDGIIKQLIEHKADVGICDLTITHERRQAVDFTVPFMSLGISILFYKEAQVPQDIFSFFKPFAFEVWMYMATAYLIVSILLFLLSRIAANEWENPHPCNPNPEELENKWCITNTTWLTMGSIMGQGCDILPKTGPMRLVNGMWWFFALMMLNSYTANLAAFLTQSRKVSSIEGINDLAEQNKIQFGTVIGGSTLNFFKESNDSIYRLAWSKMKQAKPTVFTTSNQEGLERVKKSKGLYAFLMETTSLEYTTERNCDVMQIGGQIGEKHYGIAVPLGSPIRSNLSVAILTLSEKGVLFKLKTKWWKEHNVTCEKPEVTSGNNELSIEEVGGVFLVLGAGLLVAFLMGICEFLWNVQQVAVEEKITTMEAFKQEALFALKFWITKKPIKIHETTPSLSQSRRSSQSQAQTQNVNLPFK